MKSFYEQPSLKYPLAGV